MFLGRKNQYCENDYITKCNLQIQCNPYQITNGIFHGIRTKHYERRKERKGGQKDSENKCDVSMVCVFVVCVV